jgi:hypothetical protein
MPQPGDACPGSGLETSLTVHSPIKLPVLILVNNQGMPDFCSVKTPNFLPSLDKIAKISRLCQAGVFQVTPPILDRGVFLLQVPTRQFAGPAQADDPRHVFPANPVIFSLTAMDIYYIKII